MAQDDATEGTPTMQHVASRLRAEDAQDLIRSVRALSAFAEAHGFQAAETLLDELLVELTGSADASSARQHGRDGG